MKTIHLLAPALLAVLPVAQAAGTFGVALSGLDLALVCGSQVTPTLKFSGTPPKGTKSYAVIFWDQMQGALSGRWTVFNIPLGTTQLKPSAAGSMNIADGRAATNEAGKQGYTAICSKGRHDIYIDYYALDVASLNLNAGAPLQTVHTAIKRHKLLEAKAHLNWPVK